MASDTPISIRAIELMTSVKNLSLQNIKILEKVEQHVKDKLPDKEIISDLVSKLHENINRIELNLQEIKDYIKEQQSIFKDHEKLFDKLNNVYRHYDDPNVLREHFDTVNQINQKVTELYDIFVDDNKSAGFIGNVHQKLDNIIDRLSVFYHLNFIVRAIKQYKKYFIISCIICSIILIMIFTNFGREILSNFLSSLIKKI